MLPGTFDSSANGKQSNYSNDVLNSNKSMVDENG